MALLYLGSPDKTLTRLFFRKRWLFRGKRSFGLAICLRSDTIPWNRCRKGDSGQSVYLSNDSMPLTSRSRYNSAADRTGAGDCPPAPSQIALASLAPELTKSALYASKRRCPEVWRTLSLVIESDPIAFPKAKLIRCSRSCASVTGISLVSSSRRSNSVSAGATFKNCFRSAIICIPLTRDSLPRMLTLC